MNVKRLTAPLALVVLVLSVPAIAGAKRNLADYTLRLHIYGTRWGHNGWGYHGFGRANLFDEQGTPHGVEYTYDCSDHLMASSGEEAYPARWKKQGQEIEVIFGEIGESPDKFHSCDFKVAMKSFVYYQHNGMLETESPQEFLGKHPRQTPSSGSASPDDVPRSANPHPY